MGYELDQEGPQLRLVGAQEGRGVPRALPKHGVPRPVSENDGVWEARHALVVGWCRVLNEGLTLCLW